MTSHRAYFHFHGCLEELLPEDNRQQPIIHRFKGHPAVKDAIETLGIPHSEVAAMEVNGKAAAFSWQLQAGDQVMVYDRAQARLIPLQPPPPRPAAFIVDVNLGKLARYLRLLGFDTRWRNDLEDREIVDISLREQRIILTRDRRLLFHRNIEQGYWIRSVIPDRQVSEILQRLDLWPEIHPLRRCALCNGLIQVVCKSAIEDRLEPLTRRYYDEFYRCDGCGQIYWKGSHYRKLLNKIENFRHA